jgi:putative ATP-dependent endonuclease of OLD family
MPLTRFAIRNFRGIVSAELALGDLTVLIGENGCGKSSIFDALAICLGVGAHADGFALEARDFRTAEKPPASIVFELELREPGFVAWGAVSKQIEALLFETPDSGLRRIEIRIQATLDSRGKITVQASAIRAGNVAARVTPDELDALRAFSPVILLRGGLVYTGSTGHRDVDAPARGVADGLTRRVRDYYRHLCHDQSSATERDLAEGLDAALDLARQLAAESPATLLARLTELADLTRRPESAAPRRPSTKTRRHGAGAAQLGVLLLMGAVIESGIRHRFASEHPILIVEQPEAHLHPILLASVWRLLQSLPLQRIIATQSDAILAQTAVHDVRRLVRTQGVVAQHRVGREALSAEELRRIGYHIRARNGAALFARAWLLVEGESEYWYVHGFAEVLGHDLAAAGVRCVEFAQCGLTPLVRLAEALGIQWHVLCDGDHAGRAYAASATSLLRGRDSHRHITRLREADIEHTLWRHGYADTIQGIANRGYGAAPTRARAPWQRAGVIIERATRRTAKPYLATAIVEAARRKGSDGVPPILAQTLARVIDLAWDGRSDVVALT